ncbi:MAG: stage II sporulation protein M [Thermosediminibacteraceae bacterium]|nr:stage II sporulation protein M [Thermosediminibacteraceae bacterium]
MKAVLNSFKGKGKYVLFAILFFACGIVLGGALFWQNPQFFLVNLDKILGNILKISEAAEKANKLYLAWLIFQNNARALLIMIFGGIILGLVPLFALLFNGFIVGLVLSLNFYSGKSLSFFLAAMLPHGVLELPAILVGAAFGLKTGAELLLPRGESRLGVLKKNLKEGAFALCILIPALFVAALVEAFITPLLVSFL